MVLNGTKIYQIGASGNTGCNRWKIQFSGQILPASLWGVVVEDEYLVVFY